jgi:hypothetical protein
MASTKPSPDSAAAPDNTLDDVAFSGRALTTSGVRYKQSLALRPVCGEADSAASRFRKLGESADLREKLEDRGIVRGQLSTLALDFVGVS